MVEERHDAVIPLQCQKCKTQWDEHFSLPMISKAFIQRLKVKCPKCGAGAKKIIMLPKGDFYVDDKKGGG